MLWHAELGEAPRYGTARCAAYLRDLLPNPDWKADVAEGLPPEITEEVPLDLSGLITTAIAAGRSAAQMVLQRDQREDSEDSIADHRPSKARSADRFRGMYVTGNSPFGHGITP